MALSYPGVSNWKASVKKRSFQESSISLQQFPSTVVLKPLVRLCAFVVKVACLWFEEKDILENTTGLLRHSCHLSQDKNRTKHNLESGKCRVSFHFYPPPALPSNAFASICEQRTCADLGVFPHEQVGDLLTGVALSADQGHQVSADQGHSRPPSPVSRFFPQPQ